MFFSLVAFSCIFVHSTICMKRSPSKGKNNSLSCIFTTGLSITDLLSCKPKKESKTEKILISREINYKFTLLFGHDPESLTKAEEGELHHYRSQTVTQAMESLKQSSFASDQERDAVVKIKFEQTIKELIGAHAARLYTIYYSQEAATNDAASQMAGKIQTTIEQKVLEAINSSQEGALVQFLGKKLEAEVKTIAQAK